MAEIRRIAAEDLDGLVPLVAAARAAGEFHASSDPEGAYFLDSFRYSPAPAVAAFAPDGSVLGLASGEFKLVLVRPDMRRHGIGTALVTAAAAVERERGRASILMGTLPGDAAGEAFLRATGFAHHSTVWDLSLSADMPAATPVWPIGVVARPFSRAQDLRVWAELHNTAFADHPTPMEVNLETLETAPADPAVDDLDTLLAVDEATGAVVGFCSTFADRHDGVAGSDAEVWAIGVAPDRQGRGIGRQLLRWGILRLRSQGVAEVRLSVNTRNEGAVGLYLREGFAPWRTRERWARPVLPG